MTIDASIPLSSTQLNPLQTAALAAQRMQMQQARQAGADQNALRALFAQPGAIGPDGMPTQNTLARMTQMNPEAAMHLRGEMLNQQLGKAGLSEQQWKAGVEAGSAAKDVYDQQIDQGISPAQARQNAQVVYTQNMKRLAQSGLLSPDQIALLQPQFDPNRVGSNMEMMRFREQKRESQQRLGMEGARLDLERKTEADRLALERDRLKWEIDAGKGDRQFMLTDPTQKDASGSPTPYLYDATKKQAFTLDGQPYTPGGGVKMGSGQGTGTGLSDEAANRMADQVIAGDKSALTGLGYGNAGATNRAKVQDAITRKLKEAGLTGADLAAKTAEYTSLVAGERALGTRSANLGMAANEASSFAPMVLATSDALDRAEFPTLNALDNAVAKGTGGEKVVRFVDALNAFQNAYAQVVTRGGQSTDAARQQARDILEKNWSKGQIRAGVDQLMQEIDIAKGAPSATQDELRQMFKHAQGGAAKAEGAAASAPASPAAAAPLQKPTAADDQLRAWAKDAITSGQNRSQIVAQLKAWGVPTDGL